MLPHNWKARMLGKLKRWLVFHFFICPSSSKWHLVNNAVRYNLDMEYLKLPRATAVGEFISFVHERMKEPEGLNIRYTFSGSVYFERMKELGLYSVDAEEIKARIEKNSLTDIYATCLV